MWSQQVEVQLIQLGVCSMFLLFSLFYVESRGHYIRLLDLQSMMKRMKDASQRLRSGVRRNKLNAWICTKCKPKEYATCFFGTAPAGQTSHKV